MPEDTKARSPTITRLRADETDSVFALSACVQELDKSKQSMEKRLKTIPGGWRDIALVRSVLSKLIERILETVPSDKLVSLSKNMRHMSYRVFFARPVTLPRDEVVVVGEDLEVLTRYAHEYSCLACDSDCNKCELGKALDHTMIQCRKHNESWSWIDCTKDYEDKDVIP